MLNTILCATDGSDHAETAVGWASALAAKHDAELIIVFVAPHRAAPAELRRMAEVEHLVEPERRAAAQEPGQPGMPIGPSAEALSQSEVSGTRIYREIGQRVVDAAKREAESAGVAKVQTRVADGDPAGQILEAAKRHKVDLIVMGRRGFGDLRGLLLGSVSHKVSQLAECACLTVK